MSSFNRCACESFLTLAYGGSGGNQHSALNQGRIYALDWNIVSEPCCGARLQIKDWYSDDQTIFKDYGWHPVIHTECIGFNLSSKNDYIIGYKVFTDDAYINGLELYTLNGDTYSCIGPITPNYTNSYNYSQYNFYYLSGWNVWSGSVMDGIQFQFTKSNMTAPPTLNPTYPPSYNPTTAQPTSLPSNHPSISSMISVATTNSIYGVIIKVKLGNDDDDDNDKYMLILRNITYKLTTDILDKDCIDDIESTKDMVNNATILSAVIIVCSHKAQKKLLIAIVDDGILQQDVVFVNNFGDANVSIIGMFDDEIQTTQYVIEMEGLSNSFMILIYIMVPFICCCLMIFLLMIIYKIKRDRVHNVAVDIQMRHTKGLKIDSIDSQQIKKERKTWQCHGEVDSNQEDYSCGDVGESEVINDDKKAIPHQVTLGNNDNVQLNHDEFIVNEDHYNH